MNELAHRTNYLRELTAEESSLMKKALVEMYKDVAALCERNNLTIMLCGGSCLGAVRHKGFIPWDDDLDLMMPRKDYDRLIQLLGDGELGDKYEFNTPNAQSDCKGVFLKIYLRNSLNIDLFSTNAPFPKGLYIDIFALDAVPSTKVGQWVKGFIANILQFISIMVLYAQYPSKEMHEYMSLDKQMYRRYKLKKTLGKIFGIIPHKKWVWWYDQFVSSSEGLYWGIPTGRKYYNGEIFPKSVYTPAIETKFEDVTAFIPNGYDAYLTNLYHDYMQLPPVEKRERHFIVDFKISK